MKSQCHQAGQTAALFTILVLVATLDQLWCILRYYQPDLRGYIALMFVCFEMGADGIFWFSVGWVRQIFVGLISLQGLIM
jgi:hypothetical protein